MDEDLSCFGCLKSFDTRKWLHAHEAICKVKKRLQLDVLQSQKCLSKTKRKLQKAGSLTRRGSLMKTVGQSHRSRLPSLQPSPQCYSSDVFNNDVLMDLSENDAGPSHHTCDPSMPSPSRLPPAIVPPPDPSPPPTVAVHSRRRIRLPTCYKDYLPSSAVSEPLANPPPPPTAPLCAVKFKTMIDEMGMFRVYPRYPGVVKRLSLSDVTDAPTLQITKSNSEPVLDVSADNIYSAFSHPTAGLLMTWQYSGGTTKSADELDRLWTYIQDPDFDPRKDRIFSHNQERRKIEKYLADASNPLNVTHNWRRSSVEIPLPHKRVSYASEHNPSIPRLKVDGVYHRDIIDIIISTLQSKVSSTFEFIPYEEYWKLSDKDDPIRVFGEAYSSSAFLEAYRSIHSLPREPGDDLDHVVVLLMLWLDATQLTNFGDASLWPIYLYFANQSKYTCGQPTAEASHHVAYIPGLPNDFQDEYRKHYGHASSDDMYTHCKRELMQAIWILLLNGRFADAYKNSIVIKFSDGVTHRVFPQFFTYSADYPEKILLVCIKFLGTCPCPRCLITKADIPDMGSHADVHTRQTRTRISNKELRTKITNAHKSIFKHGASINGNHVQKVLSGESLVPTRNAFTEIISDEAFNFFVLLVVDLLHKFELGVWKAIFTHLLRILYAEGGSTIEKLNFRYCWVPSYGRGTIRKFDKNASSMRCLAARDFEDLLQCAMPCSEALLPAPHNSIVLDLLFDLVTWHSYAKLRLHMEKTLKFFEIGIASLRCSVGTFQETTCSGYHTTELPQESAARGRRIAALAKKQGTTITSMNLKAKQKRLNLTTYKYHALGDYPDTIRRYGTTDNYTTQIGELEHRRLKRRYPQSGKKKASMVTSIANQEAIERFIRKINEARAGLHQENRPKRRVRTSASNHYYIAKSCRTFDNITAWLAERRDDSAFNNFLPRLYDHLLARILRLSYEGDEHSFLDEDRLCVNIKDNRIYFHSTLGINYTTYDRQHDQDSINPLRRSDIMVLSHEDERTHPYWYARVVHIFHVFVQVRKDVYSPFSQPTRMNVLFVRWFGHDVNYPSGWGEKRLHRLQFISQDGSTEPFGFIDPDNVIHGIHLIPAFAFGSTEELLGPSKARRKLDGALDGDDWEYYYINTFADHDMFMRLRGGGIGHKVMWDWKDFLERDSDARRAVNSDSEGGDKVDEREVVDSEDEPEDGEGDDEDEDGDEEKQAWNTVMEGNESEDDAEGDDNNNNNDSGGSEEEDEDDVYGLQGYGTL